MREIRLLITILGIALSLSLVGVGQKLEGGQRPGSNNSLTVKLRSSINAGDNIAGDDVLSDGRSYPNYGDANYVDGLDGVYAQSGVSNDFVMILQNKRTSNPRYAWVDFSNQLNSGDGLYPPTWTSNPQRFGARFHVLHVFSLTADSSSASFICPIGELCFQDTSGQWYMQTKGDMGGLSDGTYTYVMRFHDGVDTVVNTPCITVYFRVYHYLATATSPENWVITPDSTTCGTSTGSIATLTVTFANSGQYNEGQYLMPFQMTLTRKP